MTCHWKKGKDKIRDGEKVPVKSLIEEKETGQNN